MGANIFALSCPLTLALPWKTCTEFYRGVKYDTTIFPSIKLSKPRWLFCITHSYFCSLIYPLLLAKFSVQKCIIILAHLHVACIINMNIAPNTAVLKYFVDNDLDILFLISMEVYFKKYCIYIILKLYESSLYFFIDILNKCLQNETIITFFYMICT